VEVNISGRLRGMHIPVVLNIRIMQKERKRAAHNVEKHDGEECNYEMRVMGIYMNDATKRQISETVQIQHTRGKNMNRPDEWR
jgi:hypothetical protein